MSITYTAGYTFKTGEDVSMDTLPKKLNAALAGFVFTAINGVPIGATTSSTGAFTTLTSTGGALNGTIGAITPASGRFTTLFTSAPADSNTSIDQATTAGVMIGGTDGYVNVTRSGDVCQYINRLANNGQAVIYQRSGVEVGSVSVTTTATTYATSSDARRKTNVRDLSDTGAMIDQIRPRVFDWRSGEKDSFGFLAQELFAIAPYAVIEGDGNPDKIESGWMIDYSKLVPLLMAEVKSLRARVAVLESI